MKKLNHPNVGQLFINHNKDIWGYEEPSLASFNSGKERIPVNKPFFIVDWQESQYKPGVFWVKLNNDLWACFNQEMLDIGTISLVEQSVHIKNMLDKVDTQNIELLREFIRELKEIVG